MNGTIRILSGISMSLLLTLPAFAGSKMMLGGVDQRVPSLANQYLSQETGRLAQQAATTAAMLTVAREDAKETQKSLDAVNTFWKDWCGDRPGCATPAQNTSTGRP